MLFKIYFMNFNRIYSYNNIDDWNKQTKNPWNNYFIEDKNLYFKFCICVCVCVCLCVCARARACVCVSRGGGLIFCRLGSDQQCPRWRHHQAPHHQSPGVSLGSRSSQGRRWSLRRLWGRASLQVHPRQFMLFIEHMYKLCLKILS